MPCSRQYSCNKPMSVYFLGRQPHIRPCVQSSTSHLFICMVYAPPSSCWRSGTRPGRLNASSVSMCTCFRIFARSGGETRGAVGRGQQTVQGDDFTHCGCAGSLEVLCGWVWCGGEGWVVLEGEVVEHRVRCGCDGCFPRGVFCLAGRCDV